MGKEAIRCLGCSKYLPSWELHLKCWQCRDRFCTPDDKCPHCAEWTVERWADALDWYRRHQSSLAVVVSPDANSSREAKRQKALDSKKHYDIHKSLHTFVEILLLM